MGNLQVPLTKQLLLETHGSSGEPGHLSWSQADLQTSPDTKPSKWEKHSAALFQSWPSWTVLKEAIPKLTAESKW